MDHHAHMHMPTDGGTHQHPPMGDGGADECPMLMTWNWATQDVCILSSSWHVRTPSAFLLSLVVIALSAFGFEWIRYSRRLPRRKLHRAIRYAVSVGISFALMLIAMTFNAYIIAAIVLGAGVGHYTFSPENGRDDDLGLACHM